MLFRSELMKKIGELKAILADRKLLLGVIKKEILVISEKFGDERRTSIGFDEFAEEYLALRGGPRVFPQGFSCLVVLWILLSKLGFRLRGFHPLWPVFPGPFC